MTELVGLVYICCWTFIELSLDSSGAVIVDEYLRVKDCAGMYAMGDVSAIKCEKTGENSKAQAYTVYANIRASCLMDPELHSFHPGKLVVIKLILTSY